MNLTILILSSLFVFYWINVVLSGNCESSSFGRNYRAGGDKPREYFIACVEEMWDYAPSGETGTNAGLKNLVTGQSITSTSPEATWLYKKNANGVSINDRIGRTYVKALYREYTDACFTTQVKREEKWEHLGAIGPAIRALTGENIKIWFKNMCTFPASMHPHGVAYEKDSEGADYADPEASSNLGDVVDPGKKWVYIWTARRGTVDPGHSSQMWLYHSHADEILDIHAGLVGAIIITRKGEEENYYDLMPEDVDVEYVTFFQLYDENVSPLFKASYQEALRGKELTDYEVAKLQRDPDFYESNLMHAINGYMFGNDAADGQGFSCADGARVRWYTASFGNEKDGPHSPHWHGNICTNSVDQYVDTVVLIPGTTETVTMEVDEPGQWLYHCHVFDHIEAGMVTTYKVWAEGEYEAYLRSQYYQSYGSGGDDRPSGWAR